MVRSYSNQMETENSQDRKTRDASPEESAPQSHRTDHDGQYAGGGHDDREEHSGHQAAAITPPPELPAAPPRRALMTVGFFVLVLVVAGILTMILRIHGNRVLADTTEQDSVPTVAIVHPTAEKPDEELVLPGTLQAYNESPIYARTNGYLLRWYKDIGSRVKKGDLLADIDTPEVDQELMQARAARQQIVAQLDLAKINADRYETLRKTDSVSQEEADQQKQRLSAGAGQPGCGRRQRAPPGTNGRIQAGVCALQRRAHSPHRRSRRAD